jgi:uncharacterized protein YeaO (DUF488 family)
MAIRIVRLGTARHPEEGLRIGTVRRPPRGVRKADFARRDYFDAWLPELAPSASLVTWVFSQPLTPKRWSAFAQRYRREMQTPGHDGSLSYWQRYRRKQIFRWAATAKTKADVIDRC